MTLCIDDLGVQAMCVDGSMQGVGLHCKDIIKNPTLPELAALGM